MKFTKAITVSGALGSHFVFTSDEEKTHWIENELPKLKAEYGNVDISFEWDLPGFEIGDTCRVWGEGDEEFVIEDLKCYSPYRYGFLLDSGWYEEVAKCYKERGE
jgi:hypothetical protein